MSAGRVRDGRATKNDAEGDGKAAGDNEYRRGCHAIHVHRRIHGTCLLYYTSVHLLHSAKKAATMSGCSDARSSSTL